MEGQFYFTTIAGLSLSVAGFAALIAWLRDDARTWDPINLWRVKTIVRQALYLVFMALVLIPIFSLTDDLQMTTRLGAAGLLIGSVIDFFNNRRPDPAIWTPRSSWTAYVAFSAIYAAFHLVTIFLANFGLLQLGFLLEWLSPAGIFSNFVRELGRPRGELEPLGEAIAEH